MFRTRKRRHKRYGKKVRRLVKPDKPIRNASRIGSDSSYKDALAPASYPWKSIPPLSKYNIVNRGKLNKLMSLKSLCAETLAQNIDQLQPSHLDFAPWSCWLMVWNQVLAANNDSFEAFTLFASRLGHLNEFKCHRLHRTSQSDAAWAGLQSLRNDAIEITRLPYTSHHRLENLFSNTFITDLSSYLRNCEYHPLVAMDLSMTTQSSEDYFALFNFDLVALDLSNNSMVDDNFLYNLVGAIKDNKLGQLAVLKIVNCPRVTDSGINYLMSSSNSLSSSLAYIQTDRKLLSPQNYVEGAKWLLLDNASEDVRLIGRLPLALKIHNLHRYLSGHKLDLPASQTLPLLLKKIILDIMVHGTPYDLQGDQVSMLESTWKARIQQRTLDRACGYSYVFNNKHRPTVTANKKRTSTKLELPELPTVPTKGRNTKKIKPDAASYFSM